MPASRVRPLTAKLLRAATERPAAPAPGIDKLSASLPAAIAEAIAQLSDSPAKISVEGVEEVDAAPSEAHPFRLSAPAGSIAGFISCEPALVFALCDAVMGGSGTEPAFEPEGRPLSKIETRLAGLLASLVQEHLVLKLAETSGQPLQSAAAAVDRSAPPTDCISVRCLVSLMGQSGDIAVAVERRGLETLAGRPFAPGGQAAGVMAGGSTLRRRLPEIAIGVEVRTPPEIMALADVHRLSPGQVLRLSANIADPVSVTSGGHPLFEARLMRLKGALAVNLL